MHLATGILERGDRVLMVASRYPNHAQPLWNLPGGRQRDGELLVETLRRELAEETALPITVGALEYVSESYDPRSGTHFLNATFTVAADGEPHLPHDDSKVVALEWVARAEVTARIVPAVVREPLAAYLRGEGRRYFAFAVADIAIEFADDA